VVQSNWVYDVTALLEYLDLFWFSVETIDHDIEAIDHDVEAIDHDVETIDHSWDH